MKTASSIGKRLIVLIGMVLFVGAVGALTPGDTFAHSTSFTSTNLDLKIDSKAWYNGVSVPGATWSLKHLVPGSDKFFNFGDIKPGDFGKEVISIHPSKSKSWICLDFSNFKNKDNTQNEPEATVDPNGLATGELGQGMEFFGWLDTNGNGKFEPPSEKPLFGTSTQSALTTIKDKSYAIADASHGPACQDGATKYAGIAWCAGDLGVNFSTGAFSCNGATLGNAAQTDSISLDVSIRAEPSSQDAKFSCNPGGGKKDKGNNGVGNGEDPPPPGIGNSGNDGPGTGPGNPGGHDTAPGWHEVSDKGFHWPFSFNWNPFSGGHTS